MLRQINASNHSQEHCSHTFHIHNKCHYQQFHVGFMILSNISKKIMDNNKIRGDQINKVQNEGWTKCDLKKTLLT